MGVTEFELRRTRNKSTLHFDLMLDLLSNPGLFGPFRAFLSSVANDLGRRSAAKAASLCPRLICFWPFRPQDRCFASEFPTR